MNCKKLYKAKCVIVIVLMSVFTIANCSAEKTMYLNTNIGLSLPHKSLHLTYPNNYLVDSETGIAIDEFFAIKHSKFKSAPIFGLILGINISQSNSLELEFAHVSKYRFFESGNGTLTYNDGSEPAKFNVGYEGSLSNSSFFININHQLLKKDAVFMPYIVFGAGFSVNTLSNLYERRHGSDPAEWYKFARYKGDENINPALQIGIGGLISIKTNLKLSIDYKYRYLGNVTSIVKSNDNPYGIKGRLTTSNFLLGLRYEF